jgi:hypothetical protein
MELVNLFTFAYLSILTDRIHGWKLWRCCNDDLIVEGPSQVSTKARPHTHNKYVCALVVNSNGIEEENS